MRLPGLVVGFAPWALFLVMQHGQGDAAMVFSGVLVTALACILTVWTRGRTGVKLLGASAVLTFSAFTILVSAGSDGTQRWLSMHGTGAALFVLGIVMAVSLRSTPFTEQYAREALPDEYWEAPYLRHINARISAVWTLTVLVAAAGVSCATLVGTAESGAVRQLVSLSLQWLLPVLAVVAACRYTMTVTRIDHWTAPLHN